jgi:uncharacterized protein
VKAIKQSALMNPTFHSYWLTAAVNLAFPFYEVGIVGNNFESERNEIGKMFLPNIILFGGKDKTSVDIMKDRYVPGKTLIYICENRVCQLPLENLKKAVKQIIS